MKLKENNMEMTKHAITRMKQRGFNLVHVKMIVRYGVKQKIGDAYRYVFTKKVCRALQNKKTLQLSILEKCSGSFVVLSGNIVLTVAHIC